MNKTLTLRIRSRTKT